MALLRHKQYHKKIVNAAENPSEYAHSKLFSTPMPKRGGSNCRNVAREFVCDCRCCQAERISIGISKGPKHPTAESWLAPAFVGAGHGGINRQTSNLDPSTQSAARNGV
jgi:hypothetical protein